MSIATPTTARSGLQSTLQLGVIAIAAALAVACGGGGVGSNSTGSASGFTSGTVSGFGSIIVNGARYDDSTAAGSITGDDDSSVSSSSIKLGMEVEIEHSGVFTCPADTTQLCKVSAASISYGSSLAGLVSVNAAVLTGGLVTGGQLTVLGQTVLLTDTTVFVGFGPTGFDATYTGQVEVHGTFDNATGKLTATRVEAKTNLPAFRLRGTVTAIDTTAKTAVIGGQTVVFSSSTPSADTKLLADFATLTVGAVVRVKLSTTPNLDLSWNALKLKTKKHEHVNGEHAELEGTVASLATEGKTFKVNGVTVDYSSTSLAYENGLAADLSVAGARVEVKGDFVNGTLVATKIEFKKAGDKLKGNLEYHVTVTAAIAPTATTFTATNSSGTSFTFDIGTLVITPGIVAVGNSVEIKGYLAADGTTIVVKSVKSDSSSSSSPDDKKGKSS